MAETEDGTTHPDLPISQLHTNEAPHRLAVVERLLRHQVNQRVLLPQGVDPKEKRQRMKPATTTSLGEVQSGQHFQASPRITALISPRNWSRRVVLPFAASSNAKRPLVATSRSPHRGMPTSTRPQRPHQRSDFYERFPISPCRSR